MDLRSVKSFFCMATMLLATALSGCSGIKEYPNNLPANVEVQTKTDHGIKASALLFTVKPNCEKNFLGLLKFERSSTDVGVPVGKPLIMRFQFSSSTLFGGSQSMTSVGIGFTPKRKYRYRVYASYVDSLYELRLKEQAPGKSGWREIESEQLSGCQG